MGSAFGPIGMGVGAVVGGAVGAIASAFGPGAKDPEMQNWGNYKDMYNSVASKYGAAGSQQATASIDNPYKILAGLFDLRKPQFGSDNVPIYQQYGRMGEQKFTNDMMAKLKNVPPGTNPNTAYSTVIKPWIDSFGKGQNTGKNGDAIEGLLRQMTAQYMNGSYSQKWRDVDNGAPFATPTSTPQSGGRGH